MSDVDFQLDVVHASNDVVVSTSGTFLSTESFTQRITTDSSELTSFPNGSEAQPGLVEKGSFRVEMRNTNTLTGAGHRDGTVLPFTWSGPLAVEFCPVSGPIPSARAARCPAELEDRRLDSGGRRNYLRSPMDRLFFAPPTFLTTART